MKKHFDFYRTTAMTVIMIVAFSNCLLAQFRQTAKPTLETIVYTDMVDWGKSSGSLGFQFRRSSGVLSKLSLCVNGFYASSLDYSSKNLTKHFSGSIIGIQCRYFPWNIRSVLNTYQKNNKIWSCYDGRRKQTDPLAGFWIAPGYEWQRTDIKYEVSPDIPSPQPSYSYKIRAGAVMIQAGYQIKIWHFILGAAYGFSLGQSARSGDGPDIFTGENAIPSAFLLRHGAMFNVGIAF